MHKGRGEPEALGHLTSQRDMGTEGARIYTRI